MAKWGSFVWGDSTKWGHAVADYPHRVPLTIKMAGTDRTDSIDPATVLIEEVATKQDSRASFIVKNGGAMNLAELDAVIIAGWEQEHEFAGYIWKLEELARGIEFDYRVDCTDYTFDLKHPEALVDEEYTSGSDQYIIQHFMPTSCPGIEVSTYVEEVNSDTVSVSFDNETPFAVIERLAEDAGAEWYVDFGPVAGDPTKWAYLHYFDSGTNAAPYSLSDSPDLSASFPYKNLSEFTEAPLANKVIVIGRDFTTTRTRGAEADYGRWLVAKLVNLDITTTAQANAIGDQFLIEVAASTSYSLEAHEPGLRAGQDVTLVNSARSIDTSFMIMSLSKRFERAGLATYGVQLGKYIPSLAAIIVSDSDAGGLTGTLVCDAIKSDFGVFDELLLYLDEGDPTLGFNLDGTDLFTLGIDDSDYDKWKISLNDILGVDDILTIDSLGNIRIHKDVGDPALTFEIASTDKFTVGVDDSDDDKFKISVGDELGTNDALWIDSDGNVGGITGQPMFGVVGTLAVADDQAPWFICGHPNGLTLVSTASVVKTAGTGAAITFDIQLSSDGASWATIYSVLPSIADGSRVSTDGTLSTTTIDQGDMLRINIEQVGSTVAGADLTASLRVTSR